MKQWHPKSIHHSTIPNVYGKHLAQCLAVTGQYRRAVKSAGFGARMLEHVPDSTTYQLCAFGKVTSL